VRVTVLAERFFCLRAEAAEGDLGFSLPGSFGKERPASVATDFGVDHHASSNSNRLTNHGQLARGWLVSSNGKGLGTSNLSFVVIFQPQRPLFVRIEV
jgi:hypothetical protein